jgi:hypothetical protein
VPAPGTQKVTSLEGALAFFREALDAHPERDFHAAEDAVIEGRRRPHPVIGMIHPKDPSDTFEPQGELELPEVDMPDGPERDLARRIVSALEPLRMLNPVSASLGVGRGTGTLVLSFGIPINEEADNTPAFTRRLDEVLAEPAPDPAESGGIPEMRDRITFIKDRTPEWLKIAMPDTQGPYNLAHAVVGNDALMAPLADRDRFHELMKRVTDFWIEAVRNLRDWIGPERLAPWNRLTRICECSVNMISPEMYLEHVLPYDVRIAREFGPIDVHTCSGPHVFHVTLENLANVAATEAGYNEGMTAGFTPIGEAVEALGERPIVLRIGQMLPEGREFELVKNDLDLYGERPRLLFHYTGMHWRKADRPRIREVHARLDEYWAERYAG